MTKSPSGRSPALSMKSFFSFDHFVWTVVFRDIRYNFRQAALTVGVVAVGVTLIVFLNALISGLQRRLVSSVTGSIPHVIIRPMKRTPLSLGEIAPEKGVRYGLQVEAVEQQKRKIEDWTLWIPRLQGFDPGIVAVSPEVEGQGILSRGTKRLAVRMVGMIPEEHNRVVDIQSKLVGGRFYGLTSGETALGYKLAEEFSLKLGDKIRLTSSENLSAVLTVVGIFDTGFNLVDGQTLFLTLKDAQSLLGLGTAVTSLGIKLDKIFEAEGLAKRLALQVPYETRSWMKDNESLLTGLKAQSQSSLLIQFFTAVASGFGIASIMVMSVMNRQREIGILKAMGAKRKQIIRIFALEGTFLALIGAIIGAGFGSALSLLLGRLRAASAAGARQIEFFPIDLTAGIILTAVAVAVSVGFGASLYPASRAARVNPVEVIR
jgi:lipoprotein-releasing system permease protein